MIGMLQIITYLLAFYLMIKGLEFVQMGLAAPAGSRTVPLIFATIVFFLCAFGAAGFVWMQEAQVAGLAKSSPFP